MKAGAINVAAFRANYWLKEYHLDGSRIGAVSRIIYWQGDEQRRENGNAAGLDKEEKSGYNMKNIL